jgi:hypothetical protein
MLAVGDELKIVEDRPYDRSHKGKVTVGIIEFIDDKKITIRRIFRNKKTYLISFNIADFKDERKHFFKKDEGTWTPTKILVTEPNMDEVTQGKGSKYD